MENSNKVISDIMPCFVYFKDFKGIERIGYAECKFDSNYVVVHESSFTTSHKLETELRLCNFNNNQYETRN